MSQALTEAVVAAAQHVPSELLETGAAAVESLSEWSAGANATLIAASPAAHYREHAGRIGTAWSGAPALSGVVVGAAMRAAAATARTVRAEHKTSLVWTGPSTEAIGLRSTRSVLSTLVANATESLVLVSFAGYKVADLAAALSVAADRGVAVSLILETRDDSGGDLSFDAAKAFESLVGKASFYRWPIEAREAFFASSARLHAKCVIADRSAALITSANLTSAGINDNIELGVLIEAGPLPARLHRHLQLLIDAEILEQVS